ncbi:MAG: hypothetical protein ABSF48_24680 [Thermodesulfobacteriota bacterium]|jgi:hypothetical protein
MKNYEDYEICPECGHDWHSHFGMIDPETEELCDPFPHVCTEGIDSNYCRCEFALE